MKVLRKLSIVATELRQGDMIFMDNGKLVKADSEPFELAHGILAVETKGQLLQIDADAEITVHRTVEYADDERVM